ncbi:MAG: acyltransferase family protein [Chryseolinea sp.]
MSSSVRRFEIDWIRVIAIGLLLIYHVAIGFQPWGIMIGFISNTKSWPPLWAPMMMLNVWRIPLLFFVSGMGVYFAIQNRSWKQLLLERFLRIGVPLIFGALVIVPIHVIIWQHYYNLTLGYTPNVGHLWFLANILIYVLVLSPVFFFLKKHEKGRVVTTLKRVLSNPLGLMLIWGLFVIEAVIVNPRPYELYALTAHGFFLGLIGFLVGFCFVLSGDGFWKMILQWRLMFVGIAVTLFVLRLVYFKQAVPNYLLAIESNAWITSVFAFGHRYLNRSNKALEYLSQAAYPVYILHMVFLYLGSMLIFPLDIPVSIQFVLVLLFTMAGCFGVYEFIIRRVNILRVLFGLKIKKALIMQTA